MPETIVHVVGCGPAADPLIALLLSHQGVFGLDAVSFSRGAPSVEDRPTIQRLIELGGRFAAPAHHEAAFAALDCPPSSHESSALERASVVLDCTSPALVNRERYASLTGARGFLGQAPGFGVPYAWGINDRALRPGRDRYLQVASCMTHSVAALLSALALIGDASALRLARILCMRSHDRGQDHDVVFSPTYELHDDARFGTHHARDAHRLFATLGHDLSLWSSAVELPTQGMHLLWFGIELGRNITLDEVRARLAVAPRIALTYKRAAHRVSEFAHDHGLRGRLLTQAVVPVDLLAVHRRREIVGGCFGAPNGSGLLSWVAGALWLLDPDSYQRRLKAAQPLLFQEV